MEAPVRRRTSRKRPQGKPGPKPVYLHGPKDPGVRGRLVYADACGFRVVDTGRAIHAFYL